MKILEEIKNSPFKSLVKQYYLGKIVHGAPYFNPMYFHPTIISVRKLKLRDEKELKERTERYPHLKYSDDTKFSNLPMVRRTKTWVTKLIFGNHYYIAIGTPISIKTTELGWKDKYETPRFEWSPSFMIFFFKWQLCMWWHSPNKNEDNYWEMFLWWKNYSDKDIVKAEKTWGWQDYKSKKSTWNKNNLK